MKDFELPVAVVDRGVERGPLVVEPVFEAEKEDALSAESYGVDDWGLTEVVPLVGVAFFYEPRSRLYVIRFYCVMQRRASVLIQRKRYLPSLEQLMQGNEFLGQNRYQRLILNSSVQVDLVNHCQ